MYEYYEYSTELHVCCVTQHGRHGADAHWRDGLTLSESLGGPRGHAESRDTAVRAVVCWTTGSHSPVAQK